MRRRTLAHRLLSLFTTRERAEEIEGDLVEQSATRGAAWFARHVIGVTIALFGASCREAPMRIAMLATGAMTAALAATILCDRLLMAPDAPHRLPLLGWMIIAAAAFAIGWCVGYFGRGFGIRATTWAVLALTVFLAAAPPKGPLLVSLGLVLLSLAVLPLPLIAGSVVGQRHRDE